MIKMEIVKKHNEARDCYEDNIVAVLNYYNKSHQMMYLHGWHFDYKKSTSESIADTMVLDSLDTYELIKKYYNMEISINKFNSYEEYFDYIKTELVNKRPVIISANGFNMNWLPNHYHKEDFLHICLLNGIDIEHKKFYCCDPYFTQEQLSIPFNELKDSWCFISKFENEFHTVQFNNINNKVKIINWKEELTEFLNNKLNLKYQKSQFEVFNCFKNDIVNIDFDNIENTDLFKNPLVKNLWKLSKSYRKAICLLEYLESIETNLKFEIIKEKLDILANQWTIIRGLVIKLFITKNRKIIGFLSEKIDIIMNLDLEVVEDLKYFIKHGLEKNDNTIQTDIINDMATSNWQLKSIMLNQYNNNKGIGLINDTANFDNANFYYYKNNFPLEIKTLYGNEDITFSIDLESEFDNISSSNQRITMENKNILSIFFLGASENGNYKDNVFIKYTDGTIQKDFINFSDWFYEPAFCEQIAWQGDCVSSQKTLIPKVHLFVHKINLNAGKSCEEIVLPYCPNLHIFSIAVKYIL